jgi:Tfp pilus assembly protein PilO
MSRHKTILYSILIVAIIASYEYVVAPLQKQSEEIERELNIKSDSRSRFARNQLVVQRSQDLHNEHKKEISELLRQESLVQDVHQEIVRQMSASGVDMVQIDALPEVYKDKIRVLSLAVKATGEYAQILRLLDEVMLLPRLVNVRTLNLEKGASSAKGKDSGKLKLDVVFEYYSAREDTPPPLNVEYEEVAEPAKQDA